MRMLGCHHIQIFCNQHSNRWICPQQPWFPSCICYSSIITTHFPFYYPSQIDRTHKPLSSICIYLFLAGSYVILLSPGFWKDLGKQGQHERSVMLECLDMHKYFILDGTHCILKPYPSTHIVGILMKFSPGALLDVPFHRLASRLVIGAKRDRLDLFNLQVTYLSIANFKEPFQYCSTMFASFPRLGRLNINRRCA